MAAETEHQGSGAQCEPGRNVHPYDDVYVTRSASRNAGASVQRAVVVRQAQMGIQPRPLVRNVQAVMGT
jgi:hypothetical protein